MMAAHKADATLSDAPRNRTLQPIVTGTTVIGTSHVCGMHPRFPNEIPITCVALEL